MPYRHLALINEAGLAAVRRELGSALPRIVGYFRQDGAASLSAIENAMQTGNAAALVKPAHSLKGEARQLAAERLGELAWHLEKTARRCIEERSALPEDLAADVRNLRPLFHESMMRLEHVVGADEASAPAAPAFASRARPAAPPQRPVFGRRAS